MPVVPETSLFETLKIPHGKNELVLSTDMCAECVSNSGKMFTKPHSFHHLNLLGAPTPFRMHTQQKRHARLAPKWAASSTANKLWMFNHVHVFTFFVQIKRWFI